MSDNRKRRADEVEQISPIQSIYQQIFSIHLEPESKLEPLASLLVDNTKFHPEIIKGLIELAQNSNRTSVFAVLAALIKSKNQEFFNLIFNEIFKQFQTKFSLASLKLFAEMTCIGLIEHRSMIEFLESMIPGNAFTVVQLVPLLDKESSETLIKALKSFNEKRMISKDDILSLWLQHIHEPVELKRSHYSYYKSKIPTNDQLKIPMMSLLEISLPLPAIPFNFRKDQESLDRLFVNEEIRSILFDFKVNHKICSSELTQAEYKIVNCLFTELFSEESIIKNHTTSTSSASSSDSVPWFMHLSVVICDLCRSNKLFPKALGLAIRETFKTLKFNQIESFANWFSFHLSNFDFYWTFQEWEQSLELPIQKLFIQEFLCKLVRLSYFERILKVVPESFKPLMPLKPKVNFLFVNDPLSIQVRSCKEADQLMNLVNKQELDDDDKSTTVIISTLLDMGSKTFSHSLNLIEKYSSFFKQVSNQLLLTSLNEFWRFDPFFKHIFIDKLLKYKILTDQALIDFVFSLNLESFDSVRLLRLCSKDLVVLKRNSVSNSQAEKWLDLV